MKHEIHFKDSSTGPVQENRIDLQSDKKVCFKSETGFLIFFENPIDKDSGQSDPPLEDSPQIYAAKKKGGNGYEINIKFDQIPPDGYKYTVITSNGQLDPRICPK